MKYMSLLRYLSGRTFEIIESWGISQLEEVIFARELGIDTKELAAKRKQSAAVGFYQNGHYAGSSEEGVEILPGSIAKISLDGVMTASDGLCNQGIKSLDKTFRQMYSDSKISGILFDVNSGGGESVAGDILFNTIKDRNKPVVVHTSLLGSAAVKGTLAADEIITISNSTTVGSIGTMFSLSKDYLEHFKENEIAIYAETSENKNKGWEELKRGNFAPLIEQLNRNDELFMSAVQKYRPLKGSQKIIKNTLSGEVFDAINAKKRGLVDGIGSTNYALSRLASHIKYSK